MYYLLLCQHWTVQLLLDIGMFALANASLCDFFLVFPVQRVAS